MFESIRTTATIIFVTLAITPIIIISIILASLGVNSLENEAISTQADVARLARSEIAALINSRVNQLEIIARVRRLTTLSETAQRQTLNSLLAFDDAYKELLFLDETGQEVLRFARDDAFTANDLSSRADQPEYLVPSQTLDTYSSPVRFDEVTGEPLIIIAVPIVNLRSNALEGVLIAEFRFRVVWDLINVDFGGRVNEVYITDASGQAVAHPSSAVVLSRQRITLPENDGRTTGLFGDDVILAQSGLQIGDQEFFVIAERPTSEALQLANAGLQIVVITTLVTLVVAVVIVFLVVGRIVTPIEELSTTAREISSGNRDARANVTGGTEVVALATAFNTMADTVQAREETLSQLNESLEQRTQRLVTVATLSEQLTATFDFDQRLQEMVDRIKDNFNYYHAHVYIIDENRQRLVMTAGAGQAGAEMKAQGHHIVLNTPTSLVARAAQSGEIVHVDNVRQAEGWLSNPLLPDTYSEMAVPIIFEGQVVGVLDVQEDEIASLDESDAAMLRSLANQVAVAIHNAQQFEQVTTALDEARAAQDRYIARSWQNRVGVEDRERVYTRPDMAELPATTLEAMEKQALTQHHPTIVPLNEGQSASKPLIAPVSLAGQAIGTLQLHKIDSEDIGQVWSRQDLEFVEAIVGQLAQTAENLRLFEETRQQAARQQVLSEVGDRLRRANDMDSLLKLGLEEISRVVGAQKGFVRLTSERQDLPQKDLNPQKNGQDGY